MTCLRSVSVIGLSALLLAGCGAGKGDTSVERLSKMSGESVEPVVPISGNVTIDGEPQANIEVYLYDTTPTSPLKQARTDDEGHFCFSTYLPCDGIKPGHYKLGFEYIPKRKKNDKGEDLFKGKYKNAAKNNFNLDVEADTPQTDLSFELSMK